MAKIEKSLIISMNINYEYKHVGHFATFYDALTLFD